MGNQVMETLLNMHVAIPFVLGTRAHENGKYAISSTDRSPIAQLNDDFRPF